MIEDDPVARKRMSLRAIARMKRENHELHRVLGAVRQGHAGTRVSKLSLTSVEDAEIKTAHTLGYVTMLRDNHDGHFVVQAIKLTDL